MVFRTFTETIDINTATGGPSVLGLHTPISGDAYKFLYPFFMAYKKFRYVGMDITIVNSARLPYDPEQMGKIAGNNYVDPRDSLNPMLFKGCHGDDLGVVLDSIYGSLGDYLGNSVDREVLASALENFYYTALGDDQWRKSPIQKTLRIRGLHPIVYNLAYQHQIAPTNDMGASDYVENASYSDAQGVNTSNAQPGYLSKSVADQARAPVITPSRMSDVVGSTGDKYRVLGSMFTNKCQKLGWMDTVQLVGQKEDTFPFSVNKITLLPKIFMGVLMLPKANLVRNYLRVIITHKFKFAGYRTITTGGGYPGFNPTTDHYGYIDKMDQVNPPSSQTKEGGSPIPVEDVDWDAEETKEVDEDDIGDY